MQTFDQKPLGENGLGESHNAPPVLDFPNTGILRKAQALKDHCHRSMDSYLFRTTFEDKRRVADTGTCGVDEETDDSQLVTELSTVNDVNNQSMPSLMIPTCRFADHMEVRTVRLIT